MKHAQDIAKTLAPVTNAQIRSRDDRVVAGKALRDKLPREWHGGWKGFKGRPNPIDITLLRRFLLTLSGIVVWAKALGGAGDEETRSMPETDQKTAGRRQQKPNRERK